MNRPRLKTVGSLGIPAPYPNKAGGLSWVNGQPEIKRWHDPAIIDRKAAIGVSPKDDQVNLKMRNQSTDGPNRPPSKFLSFQGLTHGPFRYRQEVQGSPASYFFVGTLDESTACTPPSDVLCNCHTALTH